MVVEVEPQGAGKRDLPDDETSSGRSKLRKIAGKLSFDSVPPEIIARIATFQRLGADNPRQETEAATNFSQVRQNFRNATAGYPETREASDGSIVRTEKVLGGALALQLFDRRVKGWVPSLRGYSTTSYQQEGSRMPSKGARLAMSARTTRLQPVILSMQLRRSWDISKKRRRLRS